MVPAGGKSGADLGKVDVFDDDEVVEGVTPLLQVRSDPLRGGQRVVFDDESPHPGEHIKPCRPQTASQLILFPGPNSDRSRF